MSPFIDVTPLVFISVWGATPAATVTSVKSSTVAVLPLSLYAVCTPPARFVKSLVNFNLTPLSGGLFGSKHSLSSMNLVEPSSIN